MNTAPEALYQIPARYRRMENMHIIFWLLKDISWCLGWKVLGVAMIIPTLLISIVIAWRTRGVRSELAHNLAVSFWIAANSLWMITEFLDFDEKPVWRGVEGRHLAIVPFAIGMLILVYYYLFQRKAASAEAATM